MSDHSILLALILAGFVLGCIAFDLRRNLNRIVSGRAAVLVSVLFWYVLEAIRLPKELATYSQGEYDFGIFCVAVAVVAFLAAFHSVRAPLFAPLTRRMYMLERPRLIWLLVVAGVTIGLGSILIYTGFDVLELFEGLTGMRRRWTGSLARGRYGSWSSILYELQVFLPAVVPLAVALIFMKRVPAAKRWAAGVFVVWMLLRSFWNGTRSIMLPLVLPLAAAVFWTATPRLRRGLIFIGVPLAVVVGYFWSAVVVAGRNEGQFKVSAALDVKFVGVEMFRELLFVVRAEHSGMPYQYGFTYYTQLVNPIPRAIWPGKPVADAGLLLARAHSAVDRFGEPTMTISPGFLGEAYLNFGFLGLLIVPSLAGVIVRAWDELLPFAVSSLPAFLVYAGGLATIYNSGRSFNSSTFYGLISLFLLLIVFEKLGWASPPRRPLSSGPTAWPRTEGTQVPAESAPLGKLKADANVAGAEADRVRVTFLTIMPSPYSVDLFAAIEVDGRIDLRVLYMEMAAPDTHWGQVPLPDSAAVLAGGWKSLGGARVHWNPGVLRAIRATRPDLVVVAGYSSLTAQLAMRWLHWKKMPWIFWGEIPGMRDLSPWGRRTRAVARYPAVRWPDAIAAIGSRAENEYGRLARPGCHVVNIPYHTDLKPFLAEPRPSGSESLRILYCGQLIERKGVTTLLDAFVRVADDFPQSELLLVGDGPLRRSLAERVPFSLKTRVNFAGFQSPDRLPRFFSSADIFVLPSRHDGWGVVVNQALAAGLPVICTSAVGAAADLVSPGQNGFVVPPADVGALAGALRRLAADRDLRGTFGERSRAAAYDWTPSKGADRWVNVVEHVLSRRAVAAVGKGVL